jgi:hypothetical protein
MIVLEGPPGVMSRGCERPGALQEGRSLGKGLHANPFEVGDVALSVLKAVLRVLYAHPVFHSLFLVNLHAALCLSSIEFPSIQALPMTLLVGQVNFVHDPGFVLIRLHIHVFPDLNVLTSRLLLY